MKEHVVFPNGTLNIEGYIYFPKGSEKVPGVVVCHPHPQYGGDMYNNIVTEIAAVLNKTNIAAITFNFRGVGKSEGLFDDGLGETSDAKAAANYLARHHRIDSNRIGVAGYSFGAWITLEAAKDYKLIKTIACIACPIKPFTLFSESKQELPKLLLIGDRDHGFSVDDFHSLSERFCGPTESVVITGADHFFHGHETEVANVVSEFFSQQL